MNHSYNWWKIGGLLAILQGIALFVEYVIYYVLRSHAIHFPPSVFVAMALAIFIVIGGAFAIVLQANRDTQYLEHQQQEFHRRLDDKR